jgi:adenosylcobinamide-GDP ribazoletransferase
LRSLTAAIRFLTRLSIPGHPTEAKELPQAIAWFPLVGACIGALIGGAYCLAGHWWGPAIAAVLAIAFGILLTGGFHEDAAADACDGLAGGHDKESVIAIMRDPRVGAFAVIGLWLLLTLRWACLQKLGADAIIGMAFACAWGRWTTAPMIMFLPSISPGLGKNLQATRSPEAFIIANLLAVAVTVLAWHLGLKYLATGIGAAIVATGTWIYYLRRRLGGQTGDLLGAGNQMVEAVVLLAICAK